MRSRLERVGIGGAAASVLLALGLCGDAARGAGSEVIFTGMCDASAAVPLSRRLFAVADDEDDVLRVYDADRGGPPLRTVDLSSALHPPEAKPEPTKPEKKKGKKKKSDRSAEPGADQGPESDLEAATRVGDLAYWMTSHGRNRTGKRKDARLRFFATTARDGEDALRLVGRPYEGLLDDLIADPRYAAFDLAAAAGRAPKEPGGLNLEGLGERAEGGVWIGFRSPIPGGRALLAPLLNPEGLGSGERARLGDPVLLDLGGLGVRSLSRWRGRHLIVAGPPAGDAVSRLYLWDGRGPPRPSAGIDFTGLNPEGFFSPEDRDEILLLSDDGTVEIDGKECKRLDDPTRKRFRGRWIELPVPSPGR